MALTDVLGVRFNFDLPHDNTPLCNAFCVNTNRAVDICNSLQYQIDQYYMRTLIPLNNITALELCTEVATTREELCFLLFTLGELVTRHQTNDNEG